MVKFGNKSSVSYKEGVCMDYITGSLPPNEENNNDKKIDEKVLNYRKKHKK